MDANWREGNRNRGLRRFHGWEWAGEAEFYSEGIGINQPGVATKELPRVTAPQNCFTLTTVKSTAQGVTRITRIFTNWGEGTTVTADDADFADGNGE